MFRHLLRAYLVDRLVRGGRHRRHGRYGYGRRPHRRTGFHGPLPYYSTRTRRGSRVHVTGCCLPIPLGVVATCATALRLRRR
jgi:hypothetical protein